MQALTKTTNAKRLGQHTTIEALASPLLVNINHIHRVPLFFNKKQCGTTIPLILYSALKVRYMSEMGIVKEENRQVEKGLNEIVRRYLTDILIFAHEEAEKGRDISVANTLQELIFRHVVWDEYLEVTEDNLVVKTLKNKAHTVTHMRSPSVTIHAYLCRWILEKDGLNPNTEYKHVNPYVREVIDDVLKVVEGMSPNKLKTGGSFSRRIQNEILMRAFKNTMTSDELAIKIFNPMVKR
ncbi:hypothetical protein [Alteromonas sp. 14N.309.X.WAT.G.H12]|uniref:hypothetical protein n=1 Tax=Alteromonas sp. 14N.309.X.WAT.G.H12 TaxID=3120824 RepID=UPI002FD36122